MCFDPVSLGVAALGSAASAAGTKMQNDANNKAYRLNVFNQAIADEKNRVIDYANNDRINADIAAAEKIQFQGLQQDAAEAAARNQVLAEYNARQREAAAANDAAVKAAIPGFGAAGTTQQLADAGQQRGDFAAQAVAGGGAVDPNFRGSTPDLVRQTLERTLAAGRATATDRARAGAAVSAYGDVGSQQGQSLADLVGKIGLTNNFAKGDMSLLPADQELRGSLVRTPIYAPPPTLLQQRVSRPEQIQPKESMGGTLLKGVGSLAGSVAGSKSPVWSDDGKSITGYQPTASAVWGSTKSAFGI
jgi:hypothetical protein